MFYALSPTVDCFGLKNFVALTWFLKKNLLNQLIPMMGVIPNEQRIKNAPQQLATTLPNLSCIHHIDLEHRTAIN
jgi:hypothetical protein